MTLNKYASALLHIALVILAAVTAAVKASGGVLSPTEIVQLAILGVGTIGVFWAPLLDSKWQGIFKVGAAALSAVLVALVPYLTAGHFPSGADWTNVIYAGLGAVGVGFGVSIRADYEAATGAAAQYGYAGVSLAVPVSVSAPAPEPVSAAPAAPAPAVAPPVV